MISKKSSVMAKFTKYGLLMLAGMLSVACATDPGSAEPPQSPYLDEISVLRTSRAVAGEESDTGDGSGTEEPPKYDGEDIFDTAFNENSILYVAQRTRRNVPFAKTGGTDDPVTPIYEYVYDPNEEADWYTGFNFRPKPIVGPQGGENPNALNWDTVKENGSVGNGFSLWAMYYPDQVEGTRSVAEDQSELSNLLRSDILGAYHSTSALYSRVRFRLWHLMTYFKINLYVPVYKETGKTGDETKMSGYTAESMLNAWIKEVCPEFAIEWGATISSDTSPIASYINKENKTDIAMYSHGHLGDPLNEEPKPTLPASSRTAQTVTRDDDTPSVSEPLAIRPIKKMWINVASFLPEDLLDIQPLDFEPGYGLKDVAKKSDAIMFDEVYLFSFSVIIPEQYPEFTTQYPGWLQFQFESPGSKIEKNYYFNSEFGEGSSTLKPNRGTLQVMNLYLPRKGDEVILVGASIENWKEVDTDMNLPQKDQ